MTPEQKKLQYGYTARFKRTPHGRATVRRYYVRYDKSPRGRMRKRNYKNSVRGQITEARRRLRLRVTAKEAKIQSLKEQLYGQAV